MSATPSGRVARNVRVPHVTCLNNTDLVHTSFVATGLIELANSGEITLVFRSPRAVGRSIENQGRFATLFGVETDGGTQWACVDLHDGRNVIAESALAFCDRYYKANFDPSTTLSVLAGATEAHVNKIEAFVPYFACRPSRDRQVLNRLAGNVFARRAERPSLFRPFSRTGVFNYYQSSIGRLHKYRSRLTIDEYERSEHGTREAPATVFFNPRFWPEDTKTDNEHVNTLRADVIAALKRELGDRFIGGFIPGSEVSRKYPDLIFNQPMSHRDYIVTCQKTAVCIYTNGVGGCLSWKLGEYLAAGTCVVAETLNTTLRTPQAETHAWLSFARASECVEHVVRLCADPELRQTMRAAAHKYYTRTASPRAALRDVVDDMVSTMKAA